MTCRRFCLVPGNVPRKSWFYFTENELSPGAVRVGNYKFIFNLRGDDGAQTGGLAVDTNLGWKGPEKTSRLFLRSLTFGPTPRSATTSS